MRHRMCTHPVGVQCDPGTGADQYWTNSATDDMVAGSIHLGSSRVRLYNFRYKCTAA